MVSDEDELLALVGIDRADLSERSRAALKLLAGELQRLKDTIADLQRQNEELAKLADQDDLIPLANRRAFLRELSRQISHGRRHGGEACVLYIDLNDLKRINDRYGHAAGDAALNHVAAILLGQVRHEDVVGRLGGDEFGVLLTGSNREAAEEKAAILAQIIERTPLVWNQVLLPVSASIGCHEIRESDNPDHVLQAADLAMYKTKHLRRVTAELTHGLS
jgi:diguanylate cyclase (GGDEF)-like protein